MMIRKALKINRNFVFQNLRLVSDINNKNEIVKILKYGIPYSFLLLSGIYISIFCI